MFTDKDFIAYFSEIEMQERNMRDLYEMALADLTDPLMRKAFTYLVAAEGGHVGLIDELRRTALQTQLK